MTATVAHFGEENAYAAEAAGRLYPDAELVSCRSFADVMRAVTRGEAACGVLPIENSLAGVIPETYDLLAHAPLAIVDEVVIAVPHCLVGLPGTNIDALARIHSHPAALAQCRRFLSSLPDALPDVAPSTAGAARRVADAADPRQAAISSRAAAQQHGLDVLLNDVSDHAQNYTRFVAVAAHTRVCVYDSAGRGWSEASDVTHKNTCRRRVVPQKSQTRSGHRPAKDRQLSSLRIVRDIQPLGPKFRRFASVGLKPLGILKLSIIWG